MLRRRVAGMWWHAAGSKSGRIRQLVTFPGDQECLVQLGAAGQLPTGPVDEDLVAAHGLERVPLSVEVLVGGGHPPLADAHGPSLSQTGEAVT
jgi:hypothetical protein